MKAAAARRLVGFAPVTSPRTHTMVLGSFPGQRALALGQYYGNPRNQFWSLLGAVLGEDLAALPYGRRLARVLAHGFGLWDVVNACERDGSLDAAIRNAEHNDLARLGRIAPRLARIGLNGGTARRFAAPLRAAGYEVIELPSSSPAYAAMPFARKLARWRRLVAAPVTRRTAPGRPPRASRRGGSRRTASTSAARVAAGRGRI